MWYKQPASEELINQALFLFMSQHQQHCALLLWLKPDGDRQTDTIHIRKGWVAKTASRSPVIIHLTTTLSALQVVIYSWFIVVIRIFWSFLINKDHAIWDSKDMETNIQQSLEICWFWAKSNQCSSKNSYLEVIWKNSKTLYLWGLVTKNDSQCNF